MILFSIKSHSEVLGLELQPMNLGVGGGHNSIHSLHLQICLYWYMGISQRSPRGCWEFLRCVGMSCKKKKPSKHIPCAMSSTNFVLDILGTHSGKWNCSEPMRGRSCARARFFSYILPEILLAACMQSRCLHVRWLGHVCTWLCAGLCKANYGWKQLLSQQLGSSLPWVRLF